MKIYGAILSPFVCRVLMALRHKGIKHEVEMPADGLKTPEFLKLNPIGKIPVMKDGATILPESGVIVEYIDTKFPKKKIIPGTAKAAGLARLIATISELYVQNVVTDLFRQRDPKTRDKKVVKEKLEELQKGLGILNQYMADSGGPWAVGKKFTIADCYALPALFFVLLMAPAFKIKDPLAKHKAVKKYWNALKRDAMTKQVIKEMDAMAKQFFGGG